MPTQTKSTASNHSEGAAQRIRSLNEKVSAPARKANGILLDSYEKAAISAADTFEQTAQAAQIGWVSKVAAVQANVSRKIATTYAASARKFVA